MNKTISVLLITLMAFFVSCLKKDDPSPENPQNPNEAEVITTLKLILTEQVSGNVSSFQFFDLDGNGGYAPVVDNIVMVANKTYHGRIVLLDETKTPADSISNDVFEEKDEHQFFYTVTGAALSPSYTDFDNQGVPLGLYPDFVTGNAGSGTLQISLKHQPGSKPTSGTGDATKGETDIEITFNVTIQ